MPPRILSLQCVSCFAKITARSASLPNVPQRIRSPPPPPRVASCRVAPISKYQWLLAYGRPIDILKMPAWRIKSKHPLRPHRHSYKRPFKQKAPVRPHPHPCLLQPPLFPCLLTAHPAFPFVARNFSAFSGFPSSGSPANFRNNSSALSRNSGGKELNSSFTRLNCGSGRSNPNRS